MRRPSRARLSTRAAALVLATEDGSSLPVGRGSVVAVPYSAGSAVLSGDLEGVRCLPAS